MAPLRCGLREGREVAATSPGKPDFLVWEKQSSAVQVRASPGRSLQRDTHQKPRHLAAKDKAAGCVSPWTQLGSGQGLSRTCLLLGRGHIWVGRGTSGRGWDTPGQAGDPAVSPHAPTPRCWVPLPRSCARQHRGPVGHGCPSLPVTGTQCHIRR